MNFINKLFLFLLASLWSSTFLMILGFFGMCAITQVTFLRKYRNEHTNKAVGEKSKIANIVFSIFFGLVAIKFFKISYFEQLTDAEFFIQMSVIGFVCYMIIYLVAFKSVISDDKIDKHLKESSKNDSMNMHCIYLYLSDYQYNYLIENAKRKGISNTEAIKEILRKQIRKEYNK